MQHELRKQRYLSQISLPLFASFTLHADGRASCEDAGREFVHKAFVCFGPSHQQRHVGCESVHLLQLHNKTPPSDALYWLLGYSGAARMMKLTIAIVAAV